MLKQILATAVLAFTAQAVFAQTHFIKAYLINYGHQVKPVYNYTDNPNQIITSGERNEPSYFFQLGWVRERSNGRSQEFLLGGSPAIWQNYYLKTGPSILQIGKVRAGNLQFQHEFTRKKCFDERLKGTLYGGFFYNIAWDRAQFVSNNPETYYSVSADKIAARIGFVPGTQIKVGQRMVIDVSVAISFFTAGVESSNLERPGSYKSAAMVFEMPLETILRVGVACQIGKCRPEKNTKDNS